MNLPTTLDERLLHLHYSSSGSFKFLQTCMQVDPTLEWIYHTDKQYFLKFFPKSSKRASEIFDTLKKIDISFLKYELAKKNIGYISINHPCYPSLLSTIYDPPWLLYYRGNLHLLSYPNKLSVVGTRHPSDYAKDSLNTILVDVVRTGLPIVSGMAIGIDSLAHELCLKANGNTIAVLGYGLDYTYPKNLSIFKENLEKNQLVITEYPPYVPPNRWQFPERNRIISGLSQATFVIEAKEKSGSLITSDSALSQNRDVFALPGRIIDMHSKGTNRLIQEGAKMILHASDILDEYSL
ncbi:DNA-processing protein DprA [Salipaludibacillus sp. CF4.18]|uniref:DNA-processing protein DprA n=1 Tax=Salipaludibacillus sp. CF4.18 TaxID=3373081 RepID=UPI003EE731C6